MGWTAITTDTSWQELTIAQEIATAYNKRVAALTSAEQSAAGVSSISPTEAMTVFDFIMTVQDGIRAMYPYFADPSASLAGRSGWPVVFQSLNDWQVACGLTKSGIWRRIAEGGSAPDPWDSYIASGWSYGDITSKDLAGPWLFKDLETALTSLTRRLCPGYPTEAAEYDYDHYGAGFSKYDFSTTQPNPSTPSYSSTGSYGGITCIKTVLGVHALTYAHDDILYDLYLAHGYAEYTVTPVSNHAANIKLLGIPYVIGGNYEDETGSGEVSDDFGTGWTLDGLTNILDSQDTVSGSAVLRETEPISSWGPVRDALAWPPTPPEGDVYYRYCDLRAHDTNALATGFPFFVIDYDFDP